MKIILSNNIVSLVGTLQSGLGYHIEHRKNGFFSKRNQNGFVPHDGHWRFIILCAEMAQNHLYIADIELHRAELLDALSEAGLSTADIARLENALPESKLSLSADDILALLPEKST